MSLSVIDLDALAELAAADENTGSADQRAAVVAARARMTDLGRPVSIGRADDLDVRVMLGLSEEAEDPVGAIRARAVEAGYGDESKEEDRHILDNPPK